MSNRIVITFDLGDVHRIRNFGEELFRAVNENGNGKISLDQVDCAIDELAVDHIPKRQARRLQRLIAAILEKHNLSEYAELNVLPE